MKNGYTALYWTFQSTQKLTKYEVCQILDACPTSPLGPIFFIFMQFFGEIWPNNRLAPFPLCSPPIWEIRIRILDVNRTTPCRVTQNVCTWNVQFCSSRGKFVISMWQLVSIIEGTLRTTSPLLCTRTSGWNKCSSSLVLYKIRKCRLTYLSNTTDRIPFDISYYSDTLGGSFCYTKYASRRKISKDFNPVYIPADTLSLPCVAEHIWNPHKSTGKTDSV